MPAPRRLLPPLSALAAFEAVERLGSVSDAARELDLTQSAVSRQVQKLEALVGAPLFERDRNRLVPTGPGVRYAAQLRGALGQIANATIALKANPDGGVLNLAILPAFGTHWLAPRLPDFLARHGGITVNLSTRTRPFDFAGEALHGAIHFGQLSDWPGTEGVKLWDEWALAVAAPGLVRAGDLAALPRLQLETRPRAWSEWSAAQGWADPGRPAMVVDQFATLLRAAQAGLGVALMPDYLVEQELKSGSILPLPGTRPVSTGAYWLVWPEGVRDAALKAFASWVHRQSADRRAAH